MLKIRLSQTGRKHNRKYRVVVCEEHSKREGKVIEVLGYFDPATQLAKIDKKAVYLWIEKGAQPTKAVWKFLEV